MTTYAAVAARTETNIPDHLVAQADVPVAVTGGRQGDVIVVPTELEPNPEHPSRILAGRGHKVVRGDADRNSHILNGDGWFYEGFYADRVLDYGLLVVPPDGEAILTHTGEHGSIAFGPGNYRVFGQLDHQAQRRAVD